MHAALAARVAHGPFLRLAQGHVHALLHIQAGPTRGAAVAHQQLLRTSLQALARVGSMSTYNTCSPFCSPVAVPVVIRYLQTEAWRHVNRGRIEACNTELCKHVC